METETLDEQKTLAEMAAEAAAPGGAPLQSLLDLPVPEVVARMVLAERRFSAGLGGQRELEATDGLGQNYLIDLAGPGDVIVVVERVAAARVMAAAHEIEKLEGEDARLLGQVKNDQESVDWQTKQVELHLGTFAEAKYHEGVKAYSQACEQDDEQGKREAVTALLHMAYPIPDGAASKIHGEHLVAQVTAQLATAIGAAGLMKQYSARVAEATARRAVLKKELVRLRKSAEGKEVRYTVPRTAPIEVRLDAGIDIADRLERYGFQTTDDASAAKAAKEPAEVVPDGHATAEYFELHGAAVAKIAELEAQLAELTAAVNEPTEAVATKPAAKPKGGK